MRLPAYREAVEEQLHGNYDVSEDDAAAICRRRSKSIAIRKRRGQNARQTAADIASMHELDLLPGDWKP